MINYSSFEVRNIIYRLFLSIYKNRKSVLLAMMLLLTASIYSCTSDEDDPNLVCLRCTSDDPDLIIDNNEVCEGDKDPDTGDEVTRGDLQAAKNIFESLGATCTLD